MMRAELSVLNLEFDVEGIDVQKLTYIGESTR